MFPEKVILTIQDEQGRFSGDFELPASLPIERLTKPLLAQLTRQARAVFAGWQDLRLTAGGLMLDGTQTLAAYGFWDGSILTAREA